MIGPFGLEPKGTMRARALPAARALACRGHHVSVVMPPWHTPDEGGRTWFDPGTGVEIEYVELSGLSAPGLGHALVAARLARRALARRPDVVHAFKPKAYSGLAATALRWLSAIRRAPPVIVDTDDWEGPGGWNDLEPYGSAQKWFFGRQERSGLRNAHAVTVASRELETLTWALGVPRGLVTYLPNAIDATRPSDPAPRPDRTESDRPTLLLYTRFFEFALERPLEVLANVKRHFPTVRLRVAGRGLFGEETRFLEMAAGRGLAEAIEYEGWLEPDTLGSEFAGADVALYPFDDTLVNRTKSPVKLLELMSAGVAVVADAVGEPREVIEHGRSGLLVPPDNAAAMAGAVVDLLGDGPTRRAIAAGARERVQSAYTWDVRAPALEAVYETARLGR